jgi:hypothetical protein
MNNGAHCGGGLPGFGREMCGTVVSGPQNLLPIVLQIPRSARELTWGGAHLLHRRHQSVFLCAGLHNSQSPVARIGLIARGKQSKLFKQINIPAYGASITL